MLRLIQIVRSLGLLLGSCDKLSLLLLDSLIATFLSLVSVMKRGCARALTLTGSLGLARRRSTFLIVVGIEV